MNIFRITGDLLHLASILMLLWKIRMHNTCAGISLKSQLLYCIVFTCRYLDIFWNTSSLYNSVMKIIFLASSYAIVYLMQYKYKHTYDKEHDSFRIIFLIVPCFLLALIFNSEYSVTEILWTFSIYLEAVAILPQLFLLQRTGEVESLTSNYIVALGGYRFFYLLNWIYRLLTEVGYDSSNWIVWISGLIQTALFIDFFYYYVISKWYGRRFVLPQ
eukprot:TRINITY_DN4867_c0_g1_i1.p1 TRINITY_DN4867_c0_g1~~TRINITY_DN4867_c0_g1_i1.p1  ORF type:complete len:216 (+),score=23.78 TRINITY_DN4867_c0_g1_i1:186-833(+)